MGFPHVELDNCKSSCLNSHYTLPFSNVHSFQLALRTKDRQLRQITYLELIKLNLRYDVTEAARTLQTYAADIRPRPEQVVYHLRRINERFVAKGLRSEAVYWSNALVSTGVVTTEDIKRQNNSPAALFQKFRKSSLDAVTQADSAFGLRGSDLLKALTLTEVNKMGAKRRVLNRQASRPLFSAEH